MKLGLLIAPLLLLAQLLPQPRFGDSGEIDKLKLYAVGLSGMVQVSVGPGLKLENTPGGIRLSLVTTRLRSTLLVRSFDGSYPTARERVITREGSIQALGVDYDHDGSRIIPRTTWNPEDSVVAVWLENTLP